MDENANNEIVNSIKATTNCFNATHVDNLVCIQPKYFKEILLIDCLYFINKLYRT